METRHDKFPALTRDDLPMLYALVDSIRSVWRYVPVLRQGRDVQTRNAIHRLTEDLNSAANSAAYLAGEIEKYPPVKQGEEEEF